jgi:HD-GYP domain-containing protein (c-di-GMP phosphodiesterase class II)
MSKYKKIQEMLSGMEAAATDNIQIDRKKYSLIVYARSVYFVKSYVQFLKGEGSPVNLNQGIRMIRDLVELCKSDSQNFIGISTVKSEEDYLYYHSVNTAMLNILIGMEFGLNKEQLTDCAMLGFIHDIGKIKVSDAILNKKGTLTPFERQEVSKIPLHTIKLLLRARTLDKHLMDRIIAISEYNIDFIKTLKNPEEAYKNLNQLPSSPVGIYSRILSISHVYDALTSKRPWRDAFKVQDALRMMVQGMKGKFDPFILSVFIRMMRYYVVSNLGNADISII